MAAGKKRKAAQSQQPTKQQRRLPLDAGLDYVLPSKKRARVPKQHQSENKKISSDLISKIRKEAPKQRKEILDEDNREEHWNASFPEFSAPPLREDNSDEEDDADAFDEFCDTLSQYDSGESEINEEDEKVLATFMLKEIGPQLTLADIILQRIKEKDADITADANSHRKLDDYIINMYKGVGKILRRNTSGKIPNALKRIPFVNLWEKFLYLTEPQNWSVNAMYEATKIFASNMIAKRVQVFYQNILLPCIRDDIKKNGKLHPALYQSLKRALYKPAAFNKGILFPLCESGTCRNREAIIIGSIIKKVSIPFPHACAALTTLAQMEYCGTTSYLIKVFLDKKYALPYWVLDAILENFTSFLGKQTIMPVIWHQALLSFVQRYKNGLQSKDKDNLHRLMQCQNHYLVTPEIKRELKSSRNNRGERDDNVMSISCMVMGNKPIDEDRLDIPDVPLEDD